MKILLLIPLSFDIKTVYSTIPNEWGVRWDRLEAGLWTMDPGLEKPWDFVWIISNDPLTDSFATDAIKILGQYSLTRFVGILNDEENASALPFDNSRLLVYHFGSTTWQDENNSWRWQAMTEHLTSILASRGAAAQI